MKYLKYMLLMLSGIGFAQTPISLEGAIQKASEKNLNLKSGQLRIDYQEKIKNAYKVIDPLNVSAEFGQMNSAYFDNAIIANQTFRLPTFYKTQKQVLMEEWKSSVLNLDVQKWQLKREIALIYNNLNYLDEKEKLLRKTDSIYSNYYKRAELRLQKGESNILEKTTAEAFRSQAEIQLQSLLKDRDIALYQFNYLINDGETYTNEKGDFYRGILNFDDHFAGNPVVLKQLEQQKNIENAKLESEKKKLLPSFNLGLRSMTMKGNGADEKLYDGIHRFQSGVIGVGLPIFNTAQKAVIEGQKINQLIAENNYEIGVRNLKNQYAKTFGEYQKLKSEIEYYQKSGLKNAETILFTANLLLKEGETNYLEYTILVNQSLDIQNKYIDAQKLLNEKIIELNSLKSE
ncbi:TolC family protein [Chryseobacterium koreense]|uniref:Transporter n=1 Tax=Chryseobacterium koreense CCUG 49689 TaxID=1304281 RepID=A0A0J7LPC1_9FLAO|nr:TolC family protein [Chryseobacterium koreense]KMQ70920.1 transporter [Chryseobacterium koreense CCUG 49689]MBB5332419.1 outer membrane protein TolC [Chryseobacterium koreense]